MKRLSRNIYVLAVCGISACAFHTSSYGNTKTVSLKDAEHKDLLKPQPVKRGTPVSLYVFEENISAILAEIAKKSNISVKIEKGLKGTVRRMKLSGFRNEVLDRLAQEFNFDWFEYNSTLYISSKSERSTKFFRLGNVNIKRVVGRMKRTGANLESFLVRKVSKDTVSVSGPPSYVAILETIIETQKVKEEPAPPRPQEQVCVIKGTKPSCVSRENPLFRTTEKTEKAEKKK